MAAVNDLRAREPAAALLERAYRMALLLQARCAAATTADDAAGAGFERHALAAELLALLDEARAALLR